MGLTLVIGGTRSGKSARAESLASAAGLPVRYVGTADPADGSGAPRHGRRAKPTTAWRRRSPPGR
jgi:adenosylcobinamide kinase/adenosylcobinamide-phosphate guanylyltransferase